MKFMLLMSTVPNISLMLMNLTESSSVLKYVLWQKKRGESLARCSYLQPYFPPLLTHPRPISTK